MPCIVDPNSCSCLFLSAAAAPECCAITIGQSLFSLWACVCAGQWLVVGFCVGQYGIPERRVGSTGLHYLLFESDWWDGDEVRTLPSYLSQLSNLAEDSS